MHQAVLDSKHHQAFLLGTGFQLSMQDTEGLGPHFISQLIIQHKRSLPHNVVSLALNGIKGVFPS